jgi:hypothetical protein
MPKVILSLLLAAYTAVVTNASPVSAPQDVSSSPVSNELDLAPPKLAKRDCSYKCQPRSDCPDMGDPVRGKCSCLGFKYQPGRGPNGVWQWSAYARDSGRSVALTADGEMHSYGYVSEWFCGLWIKYKDGHSEEYRVPSDDTCCHYEGNGGIEQAELYLWNTELAKPNQWP